MSVSIVYGDLLLTNAKYICHQVNCMGKMGSGLAKQIRKKYPEVYKKYSIDCKIGNMLGRAIPVVCSDGKIVINMFAQERYGMDESVVYTDYEAFQRCLREMESYIPAGACIAMPYKIGCGLGGGNWKLVYHIINKILGAKYDIELWRLP